MKVDNKTARHLASLSNISMNDDEITVLASDLGKIVEYIGELGELDTSGVEPTYQVTGLSDVWREDEIADQLPREELLRLSANRTKNTVKVPKVL